MSAELVPVHERVWAVLLCGHRVSTYPGARRARCPRDGTMEDVVRFYGGHEPADTPQARDDLTYVVDVTCAVCGGVLRHAHDRERTERTAVSIARCVNPACRRTWAVRVEVLNHG